MNKLIVALVLLFTINGCKDGPSTPPTVVLDSMLTEMKNGNIEGMKKYITKSDVAMLEAAEKFMAGIDSGGITKIKSRMAEGLKENAKKIHYTIKDEKIDGNHASVEAEIITKDSASQEKITKQTFELVKEDNAWKIALSKPGNEMFNSMKGNMGKRDGDLKDGLEKLQKMDPDTLKLLIKKGLQALDSMDLKKKKP